MSLDTVLKIGKALRNSEDSLKFFKYVSQCPTDKKGNYPLCINLPILADFSLDWDNISQVPENKRGKLCYLKYKTTDTDNQVKYIFGDIHYGKKITFSKKNKEISVSDIGYFKLNNKLRKNPKNSIDRGFENYQNIKEYFDESNNIINKFREKLLVNYSNIEKILDNISAVEYFIENNKKIDIDIISFLNNKNELCKATKKKILEKTKQQQIKTWELDKIEDCKILDYDYGEIFLHFEFPKEKSWYDFKEVKIIYFDILNQFSDVQHNNKVLKKTIYYPLLTSNEDMQFPKFDILNRFKVKSFTDDDILDLFYGIDYSLKGLNIYGADIRLVILPYGTDLQAHDYLEFQEIYDEIMLLNKKDKSDSEPIFDILEKTKESIKTFDFIFMKPKTSKPSINYTQISGIQKSKLANIRDRITKIKREVYKGGKSNKIEFALKNILSETIYQQHVLKILPKIYTENYYSDKLLLPQFNQTTEKIIRSNQDLHFYSLKKDFEFLASIQNTNIPKGNFMKIIESSSYKTGVKLGKLARPLKTKINSFEKNYVGLLSRRVTNLETCVRFLNEIDQKLIMHERSWTGLSKEIHEELANLSEYNKEHFQFGFFEGYFTYQANDSKEKFIEKSEKLISDFSNNEELERILENLKNEVDIIKNQNGEENE